MSRSVFYLPETEKDFQQLSRQQILRVMKAIEKVCQNPIPQSEGGYGKPLGHKRGINLTGLFKIKLKNDGIRVVYSLIRTESQMLVVVIGLHEDEEVYEIAQKRAQKHRL